jgi:hypothetical protein
LVWNNCTVGVVPMMSCTDFDFFHISDHASSSSGWEVLQTNKHVIRGNNVSDKHMLNESQIKFETYST